MDDIDRFMHQFLNRQDTYCLQGSDGRYSRRYARLDKDLVMGHLLGQHTLAVDSMNRHGFARWLCFDSDVPAGLAQLAHIQSHLGALGVLTLREASRRGGHLWLLAADAVPASLLRDLATLTLRTLGLRCEVYPDKEAPDGVRFVTHPVRLPLGVHRLTGQRYPFLSLAGRACYGASPAAALTWLVGQAGNRIPYLRAAIGEMAVQLVPDPLPPTAQGTKATGIIGWVNGVLDLRQLVTVHALPPHCGKRAGATLAGVAGMMTLPPKPMAHPAHPPCMWSRMRPTVGRGAASPPTAARNPAPCTTPLIG